MNGAVGAADPPACRARRHHTAGIIFAPTLPIWSALISTRAHGWSKQPIIEMVILWTLDDSLAPPGCHVASLFVSMCAAIAQWGILGSQTGNVADLMIDTVNSYAPNFKASGSAAKS
jgi:phytoene dehydrogenase-like protein